jgi:hypothetical protein
LALVRDFDGRLITMTGCACRTGHGVWNMF